MPADGNEPDTHADGRMSALGCDRFLTLHLVQNTEAVMRSTRLALMLGLWVISSAAYGQGQVLNRTLEHDGLTRSYTLYVPAAYTGDQAWPLVLNMHFMGGNAAAVMTRTGFNGVADAGN